jgi:hypothetical protein
MNDFKIDKTCCKAHSFDDADSANVFEKTVPAADRLRMAFHLSCTIYGIKEGDSLKLDKTVFSKRKFNNA